MKSLVSLGVLAFATTALCQDEEEFDLLDSIILTDSEFAIAEEEEPEEEKATLTEEEITEIISKGEMIAEQAFSRLMEAPYLQVIAHTHLDEARKKRLADAKEAVVKTLLENWRKEKREQIPDWDEQRLEQFQAGRVSIVDLPDPKDLKIWTEALQKVLTEDDHRAMEKSIVSARERRCEALMRLLISNVDESIGFRQEQRVKMLALGAPRLLKLEDSYFQTTTSHSSIDLGEILMRVDIPEITNLFDEGQKNRWEKLNREGLASRQRNSSQQLTDDDDLPAINTEVEAEALLAGLLFDAASRERKKHRAYMESRLDLVCGVTQASDESRATLATLAKGAAEMLAAQNITNMDSYIRRQLRNTAPSDFPKRLPQVSVPNYSYRNRQRESTPALWDDALKQILTTEQTEAIELYDEAVTTWRQEALAMAVLTEVEKHVSLPLVSRDALWKRLQQVIEDFEPELNRTFSFSWPLQGYYSCMPLEMLGEKGLVEFFNESDLKLLRERCLVNTGQFREQIRNQQAQRIGVRLGVPPLLAR